MAGEVAAARLKAEFTGDAKGIQAAAAQAKTAFDGVAAKATETAQTVDAANAKVEQSSTKGLGTMGKALEGATDGWRKFQGAISSVVGSVTGTIGLVTALAGTLVVLAKRLVEATQASEEATKANTDYYGSLGKLQAGLQGLQNPTDAFAQQLDAVRESIFQQVQALDSLGLPFGEHEKRLKQLTDLQREYTEAIDRNREAARKRAEEQRAAPLVAEAAAIAEQVRQSQLSAEEKINDVLDRRLTLVEKLIAAGKDADAEALRLAAIAERDAATKALKEKTDAEDKARREKEQKERETEERLHKQRMDNIKKEGDARAKAAADAINQANELGRALSFRDESAQSLRAIDKGIQTMIGRQR